MNRSEAAEAARQYRAGTHPDQAELRDYAQPPIVVTVTEAIGCVFAFSVAVLCLFLALYAALGADAEREAAPSWVPVCATEAECDALIRELERAPIDIWSENNAI